MQSKHSLRRLATVAAVIGLVSLVSYGSLAQESQAAPSQEDRIISVYESAGPSVVNITSLSYVYYRFLGNVPQEGTGSGFIYDSSGHIVTNYHVIQGADQLMVTLTSGKTYTAQVVGTDPSNDLAVIHIDVAGDLPSPLVLADSSKIGQEKFAVIANLNEVDLLITDSRAPDKLIKKYRKGGARVKIADSN